MSNVISLVKPKPPEPTVAIHLSRDEVAALLCLLEKAYIEDGGDGCETLHGKAMNALCQFNDD